jgi:hypothetical protein
MVNQTEVKRNTMIGNFEMGGLNMIDIGSYFASLRASLSGTTHALATKVNIGMTNALIIITFPRIVKFRFPQEKNKVFILSILFSQFNFSHSSIL